MRFPNRFSNFSSVARDFPPSLFELWRTRRARVCPKSEVARDLRARVLFLNPSSERPGYRRCCANFGNRVGAGAVALILSLTAAVECSAQTPAAPPSKSLWDLLAQGGWAMWPLGLCSLVMFFLIYLTWRETLRARFVPDALLPQIKAALEARDVAAARQMMSGSRTVLSRAMLPALQRARPSLPDAGKAHIEANLAESLEVEDSAIGQWINYLNVVATVAPMIGLLGTVSGMIGAFQTISTGGMGRPELLAGDIGEALITTATGLVIGIPAMIAYFVMRNRLANQMTATTQVATDLVDTLAGETSESGE